MRATNKRMAIRSFQQLKRILRNGVMRRLYIREQGRLKLRYYILFIPEHTRYIVFHCTTGIEYRFDEAVLLEEDPLQWRRWLRSGVMLVELD